MSKIEQSFKHFLELPPELRMMVNDEMLPDDKCRFSGASKRCNIEAKLSKNYIEFIRVLYFSNDKIQINDRCVESSEEDNSTHFYFEFEKEGDQLYMKYKQLDQSCGGIGGFNFTSVEKELWREKLSDSKTLVEHAIAHFKKLLQTYQKTIKQLEIESIYMGGGLNFDAEVTNLKNLEELTIEGDFNSIQYISKTKRPLKKLAVTFWNNEFPLEKIYQVYDDLFMPDLKLNNQQFLRLSATKILMDIGELTAEDVFNFLQSWFNGTLGRKMRFIDWSLTDSQFDVAQLLRLFKDYGYTGERRLFHEVDIEYTYADKKIRLSLNLSSLQIRFCYEQTDVHNSNA